MENPSILHGELKGFTGKRLESTRSISLLKLAEVRQRVQVLLRILLSSLQLILLSVLQVNAWPAAGDPQLSVETDTPPV